MIFSTICLFVCLLHAAQVISVRTKKVHLLLSTTIVLVGTFFSQDAFEFFLTTMWLPVSIAIHIFNQKRRQRLAIAFRIILILLYTLTTTFRGQSLSLGRRKLASLSSLALVTTVIVCSAQYDKTLLSWCRRRIKAVLSSKKYAAIFLFKVLFATFTTHVFLRCYILPKLCRFMPRLIGSILLTPFQFAHLHRVDRRRKADPCLFCIASLSVQTLFTFLDEIERGCWASSVAFFVLTALSCR